MNDKITSKLERYYAIAEMVKTNGWQLMLQFFDSQMKQKSNIENFHDDVTPKLISQIRKNQTIIETYKFILRSVSEIIAEGERILKQEEKPNGQKG